MKNIILEDWLDSRPHMEITSTDYYYVKLANKLYDAWRFCLLKDEFDVETRRDISLRITAYFEDVISGIGLWQTFIRNHKKITGKYLPFYMVNEEDYYEDEINFPDVCFLIWSYLQRSQEDTILVNPENLGIIDLAERMYKILDNEFEQAPVNDDFLDFIKEEVHYKDFFSFKLLANWLFYDSYLLGYDSYSILEREMDFEEDEDIDTDLLSYAIQSSILFNRKTGPLALTLPEWFGSWLRLIGMEKEAAIITAIETTPNDYFLVNKRDEKYYYTTNTQGVDYPILRSSFEEHADIKKDVIISTLVKYDGEWYINGLAIWTESDKYNEKKEEKDAAKIRIKMVNDRVLKATKGYPLAYFKNMDDLQKWLSDVLEAPGFKQQFLQKETPIVVFAEPDKDLSVMEDLPYCIKDDKNPYYNKQKADEIAISLLTYKRQSTSRMIRFLLDNKMLPDARINSLYGKERGLELVQQNMEFMVRFFWLDKY